jgi:gluconate 2-dehydrogenase alpha chain
MAIRLDEKDVVVVGLGAAGGIAVLPLTRAGLEVVGLEAGPALSTRDFVADEVRSIRNWMAAPKGNTEVPTRRLTSADVATRPKGAVHPMLNAVGGTTIHWTGRAWRYHPWNFQVRSEAIRRWGAGSIPPGSTVADWPFNYDDLEQYYDKAEYLHGVSGQAGNIQGTLDPRGNPFEGPRRRPFPLPPLRGTGWMDLMTDAAKRKGWHPFPGPAGIRSQPYKGLPACEYHGFCSGYGCHADAKAGSQLNGIPEAKKTGNLKVVSQAWVTKIGIDKHGRASGVHYVKGGREYFQPAKVVLLASYTFENVRLLLLSKSAAFPNGLANNSGQVGKHFATHSGISVNGLFPDHKLNLFYGTGSQWVVCDDFEGHVMDSHGDFISFSALHSGGGERTPISSANATPPTIPVWGPVWKDWIAKNAGRVGGPSTHIDVLTYEQNYLDLDPTTVDPMGNPVTRVTYSFTPHEQRAATFYRARLTEWLMEAGASQVWGGAFTPNPVATHAFGGTRAGNDPDTSVVDKWGFAHEVPNLGVLGGSTFPTSGGRNPTGTIWATAWRTADHLTSNWESISEE